MSAYRNRIQQTESDNLIGYWTLGETFGTTAEDLSGNNHDGTANNVAWGEVGIGDGNKAAQFTPADSSSIDVHSSELANAFNGEEGTLAIWMRVRDASVWTDGSQYLIDFRKDGSNWVWVSKSGSGELKANYNAGGVQVTVTSAVQSTTDWLHVTVTWSKSADALTFYLNGSQVGNPSTGLGTWSGTPGKMYLGERHGTTYFWDGFLAHAALWDKPLSANQISVLAMQSSAPTVWAVDVDWDRDGSFVTALDNISDWVISAQWFLGEKKPYQDTADNSTLSLTLKNVDRRFSPENSSSPLAGKLGPVKPIRLQSNDGLTNRTHWVGWIDRIQPKVNINGERTVEITASGSMQFLRAAETRIALQENQRTDQIIDALLQDVVIPPTLDRVWILGRTGNSELGLSTYLAVTSAYSDLDQGATTLALAGDNWVNRGGANDQKKDTFDVYQAIKDVVAAERGRFLFARDGKALFWNRHHLMVTPPNRIINGDFVLGETGWTFYGGIVHSVASGKLRVYRNGGSAALVYQDFAYAMRPGDTFTVTFDVANTSGTAKTFDVVIRASADYDDQVYQRFTIPAGANETTYRFNGTATGAWEETRLEISIVTDDNDADLTFDNIAVRLHTFDNTMTGLSYQYAGLDQFKNEIVVVCHPRTLSDNDDEVLWALEERVEARGGENHTFEVKYRDDAGNRIGGKDVRVENARFWRLEVLKAFERKTDNDLVELDAGANSATLTIRNKGGYKPAVLVECELQGRKITDFGQMEAIEVDAVSIRDYGRRTLRLNLPSVDSYEDARQIAQYELSRRSLPGGAIGSMTLKTHGTQNTRHHTMQLALTLGDKVFIDEDQTDHQADYCIIGEDHKLSNSATLLETTWYLEAAPSTYPWQLGVTGRSELGATTQLVY